MSSLNICENPKLTKAQKMQLEAARSELQTIIQGIDQLRLDREDIKCKVDAMDIKLGAMDLRLDAMDLRLDAMDLRLDAMNLRLAAWTTG
ncbi:hypothetical protein BDN67DRAFT_971817 [Paxillus ammoniavirescens]|nr:hypothetical protein BDN67DRAFT_971817 [Paxillus ammoniavirescens]